MLLVLLVLCLLIVVGGFPAWPYARGWSYWPSGLGFVVVLVLLVLIFRGRV